MDNAFVTCSAVGCSLQMVCERKHHKSEQPSESYNFLPIGSGECDNYIPRKALTQEKDIFRPGGPKHNRHMKYNIKPGLPKAPDLMVKRHIRSGKDINLGTD